MIRKPSQPPAELVLPDTIHELLDESLKPAGDLVVMHGGNTELFVVEGHPELFVRLNRGDYPEDIEEAVRTVQNLNGYGVDVLPARVVRHDDEAFVVTKKVEGQPLVSWLTRDTPEGLFGRVDSMWAGLARNLMDGKVENKPVPSDVTTPEQYMLGTVAGETQPRVWLIDLPQYRHHFRYPNDYAEAVLDVANGIAVIQTLTGTSLRVAQSAVREAAALAENSPLYGDGIANAITYVMEHNVKLDLEGGDEDKIIGLRTK